MNRSFESLMVEQCAPTLAGIKPASLFRCGRQAAENIRQTVETWDHTLARLGLRVRILKECPSSGDCMIYVYRPEWVGACCPRKPTSAFWTAAATGGEVPPSCWTSCPTGSAWSGTISMRSVCSWGIPCLMSSGLSKTKAGITPAADAGNPTATPKKPRPTLTSAAGAPPGTARCMPAVPLSCILWSPRKHVFLCCLFPSEACRPDTGDGTLHYCLPSKRRSPAWMAHHAGQMRGKKEISIKWKSGFTWRGSHQAASLRPSSRQTSCASASGASFTVNPSSS